MSHKRGVEVKSEDECTLAQYKIMRDNKRIGWIVQKDTLGFLGFTKSVVLVEEERWQLAKQLSPLFHVIYEVKFESPLYDLMRKIWSGETLEKSNGEAK